MEIYDKDNKNLENNKVIIEGEIVDSKIIFEDGVKNSTVIVKKGVYLNKSKIIFTGSDSLVYFDTNKKSDFKMTFTIQLAENSCFYFGKDSNVNTKSIFRSEVAADTNVFIGNDLMAAVNCKITTSDYHGIFDMKTTKLINPNKSVFVGDHIWFGEEVHIGKGSMIGSGSVLGLHTKVFGKKLDSNSLYVGTPARKVKDHITWEREKILNRGFKTRRAHLNVRYHYEEKYKNHFEKLDKKLIKGNVLEKIKILDNLDQSQNRFYIGEKEKLSEKIDRKSKTGFFKLYKKIFKKN